jgi:hypothetical protein
VNDGGIELHKVRAQIERLLYGRASAALNTREDALYRRLCCQEGELLAGAVGPVSPVATGTFDLAATGPAIGGPTSVSAKYAVGLAAVKVDGEGTYTPDGAEGLHRRLNGFVVPSGPRSLEVILGLPTSCPSST